MWHIATSLFEMKNAAGTTSPEETTVATTLSKYCTYLVACAPELLPENQVRVGARVQVREGCPSERAEQEAAEEQVREQN